MKAHERHADSAASALPQSTSGVFDDFFVAGDEGRYEGGPAQTPVAIDFELDEPAVPVVVRTPEMDARRARFARVVAVAVGCFGAVLAVGLVRHSARASSSHEEPARVAQAQGVETRAPREVKLAPREVAPAPRAEVEPSPTPAIKTTAAPVDEPVVKEVTPPIAPPVAAKKLLVAATPSPWAELPKPPQRVAKPVTPLPASTLPNVASFGQKSPASTLAKSGVPTASF